MNNEKTDYIQYEIKKQIEENNLKKYEAFKIRMEEFSKINSLEEAKALASKILPVAKEISHFNIGNAKCTIINRDDLFRISLDSSEEFTSYNFE